MKRIVILTGLSGSGKTTIANELLTTSGNLCNLKQVVTTTTRPRRGGEVDGKSYHFISKMGFEKMVEAGTMLEHANVYGNYYGTSQDALQEVFDAGCTPLLICDIQGAVWWRMKFPAEAVIFFIAPPNAERLEQRLRRRGTDTEDVIQRRMQEAAREVRYCNDFTYLIVNHHLERAVIEIENILL